MLFDFACMNKSAPQVIGSSVRINDLQTNGNSVTLRVSGAGEFRANLRVYQPFRPSTALLDGKTMEMKYDERSSTVLLSYDSTTGEKEIVIR